MNAQEALKAALRDELGPEARRHGYRGSPPTWRKLSDAGDCSVVNVQSSSLDDGSSDALESQLAYAVSKVMPSQRENAEQFDSWVRTQAAGA